jgi:hypothetical protein
VPLIFDDINLDPPAQPVRLITERNDRPYHDRKPSRSKIIKLTFGLLKTFVFADKYSVHQLRNDILSALMGYTLLFEYCSVDSVYLGASIPASD